MKQFENKELYEGSYNFGPDDNSCVTTRKLAEIFCSELNEGINIIINEQANKPHEANILKLDCAKSKSVLGWRPEWNITQAVKEVVSWLKIYRDKGDIISYMDAKILDFYGVI